MSDERPLPRRSLDSLKKEAKRWLDALRSGAALRALSVSCLNVDDTGISALPAFPALRELMPMDVPDAGYRHIGKCEQLESLVLMYCRDTTDAATELPRLTELRVSGKGLTQDVVKVFPARVDVFYS